MTKCKKHPEYKVISQPRYKCPTCWKIWDRKMFTVPATLSPWHDKKGKLTFPYRPLSSQAFVWPAPPPETLGEEGCIVIPIQYREYYAEGYGILLAIGPGYWNKKNKWIPVDPLLKSGVTICFDKTIPYRAVLDGPDGKHYEVMRMVEADIGGVVQ